MLLGSKKIVLPADYIFTAQQNSGQEFSTFDEQASVLDRSQIAFEDKKQIFYSLIEQTANQQVADESRSLSEDYKRRILDRYS